MSVIGFHGDPCQGHGCIRLQVKHRAETDGLCRSCWLGSSQPQRLDAELEALLTPPPAHQIAQALMLAELESWLRL